MRFYVFVALSVPGATFCLVAIAVNIRKFFHETVANSTPN